MRINGYLKKVIYTVIAGVSVVAITAGWSYGYRVATSDPPPWSSVKNRDAAVAQITTDIEAMINERFDRSEKNRLQSDIRNMWVQCNNAARAKNLDLADSYSTQLAGLQASYQGLNNGQQFPLHCP